MTSKETLKLDSVGKNSVLINLQNQRTLPESWFPPIDLQSTGGLPQEFLPIYCASPFMGQPLLCQTVVEVWPDVNILAHARVHGTNPNVTALSEWVRESKFGFDVLPAYLEHHRTNDTLTAWDIAKNSAIALHDKYGFEINHFELIRKSLDIPLYSLWNHEYTDSLAYFVVVIRYLYSTTTTFEKRCSILAKMIGQKFPKFTMIYYLACLYFYVRDNRLTFPDAFDKLQEDMQTGDSIQSSWKNARNFASDITFFTRSSLYPIQPFPLRVRVPYIATTDAALILILQQICYTDVRVSGSIGNGYLRYRPGTVADIKLSQLVKENIIRHIVPFIVQDDVRRQEEDAELKRVANEIVAGNFSHKDYFLIKT